MRSLLSVAPTLMTSGNRPGVPAVLHPGPGVAGREDRDDPGRAPGLDRGEVERVVGVVVAPRVADDVGALARIGVVPLEVGRGDHELARRQQRALAAVEVLAALGRDPLGAGCHADVRQRAAEVAADDRSQRVGPVARVVAGHVAADAGRVPPVVVVAERAVVVVAAVVLDERGVGVVDAGVDRRDGDALAGDPLGPDLVGADLGDAPLGRLADVDHDLRIDRLDQREDLLLAHDAHARQRGEPGRQGRVAVDEHDVRQPVALGPRARRAGDDRAGGDLRGRGRLAERVEDRPGPLRSVDDPSGPGKVGLGGELDDEPVDRLRLEGLEQAALDLGVGRRGGPRPARGG